jgi:hypothetical protein
MDFGHAGNKSFTVDLDRLQPASGYITMGDSDMNMEPDQNNNISKDRAVGDDRILAVAAHEIPWLGCIKLLVTGTNTDRIPGNSIISLIITLVAVVAAVFFASYAWERFVKKRK